MITFKILGGCLALLFAIQPQALGYPVQLQEILSIGVKDGDANRMFYMPSSVRVSSSGDIFVLDAGNHRIQRYDSRGRYVLTIGRKGEGPGEMLDCRAMDMDSFGNLVLFDFGNSRVSVFSSDGAFVRSVNLGFPPIKGAVDSKNNIYVYYRHNRKLIHKYDAQGNHIKSFMDELGAKHPRLVTNINISGQMAVRDDKIFLLLPYPYTIHIFDTNGRALDALPVEGDYPERPFLAPDGMVIMNFAFTGLAISPNDFICNVGVFFEVPKDWAAVRQEILADYTSHTFLDVFAADGEHIGHAACPGMAWGGCFDAQGHYYAILEEDEGFHRVVKYRMTLRVD